MSTININELEIEDICWIDCPSLVELDILCQLVGISTSAVKGVLKDYYQVVTDDEDNLYLPLNLLERTLVVLKVQGNSVASALLKQWYGY